MLRLRAGWCESYWESVVTSRAREGRELVRGLCKRERGVGESRLAAVVIFAAFLSAGKVLG